MQVKIMTRKHFSAATFLERLADLEKQRQTPTRMKTPGRERANNSLAGIEFSTHERNVPNHVPKRFGGERKHSAPSPAREQSQRATCILADGTFVVKKHAIRIIDAANDEVHFSRGMVAVNEEQRPGRSRGLCYRSHSPGFEALMTSNEIHECSPRFGKRFHYMKSHSLEHDLVPRQVVPSPKVEPEPLPDHHHRRVKRFAPDPAARHAGEERTLPDFGHKAMVAQPTPGFAVPSRKAFPVPLKDHLEAGTCAPTVTPVYHNLTRPSSPARRSYDVVTLYETRCQSADRLTARDVPSPRRAGVSGTPLRFSDLKNRSSSPNILAWN